MPSDFLDKFKGKANKVSKEGYQKLFKDRDKSKPKIVKIKTINATKNQTFNERNKRKKKQKTSPNKQNKPLKVIVRSASQRKIVKSNAKDAQRKIFTQKQNKKYADNQPKDIKQTFKLPKIGRQKSHIQNDLLVQKKQNIQIVKLHKQNLLTQINDQKQEKIFKFDDFLDEDAIHQLKWLNQFQNFIIQRKIQNSILLDQIGHHNNALQHSRKGVTVHY